MKELRLLTDEPVNPYMNIHYSYSIYASQWVGYKEGYEAGKHAQLSLDRQAVEEAVMEEAEKIGEALCIIIGNQMIASPLAGKLLADQLTDIIKLCQTDAGIIFEVLKSEEKK